MTVQVSAEEELLGLRDFQRRTARYTYQRLFGDGADSTSRFLVADEVGLGKTLVARGVIAQIIEHLQKAGDRRIDIVYVASNASIAAQNLRKLAPRDVPVEHHSDRLSLLPYRVGSLGQREVNLVALTPKTSMDLRSSSGTFRERVAAFAALRSIWGGQRMRGVGIAKLFAGNVGDGGYASIEARVRATAAELGELQSRPAEQFKKAISDVDAKRATQSAMPLDEEIHDLARYFARGRVPPEIGERSRAVIRQLRESMAWTGVDLLQPDLVILDEFQRFRELMAEDGDEWTGQIAKAMFNYHHKDFDRMARVLLLSATPYVMHTTAAEAAVGSDRHYDDFLQTYRFLAGGMPDQNPDQAQQELREKLATMRSSILDVQAAGVEPVRGAALAVSQQLSRVMVRTERLASTVDHNGMMQTVKDQVGVPSAASLGQYVGAAQVADHLRGAGHVHSADVIEYWKSAPYTLSFLGGHEYMLSKALFSQATGGQPDEELVSMVRKNAATLPWRDIDHYRAVDPANGRLEQLWADFFDRGAHRLLWMPPACPYYEHGGRFDTDDARRLTKRLIFSSWTLVPTVISTMTSFEAERRLHDEAKAAGRTVTNYSTEANRRHIRHLDLGAGTQSMSAMLYRIPSPALADLCDPLKLVARIRGEGSTPTWQGLVDRARGLTSDAFDGLLPTERSSGPGSAAWYVMAPLLLDALRVSSARFDPRQIEDGWYDPALEDAAVGRYLRQIQDWLHRVLGEEVAPTQRGISAAISAAGDELPSIPQDLEAVVALSGLASPPNCALRALGRQFPEVSVTDLVWHSVDAAAGFVSLLNSWEAARVIDAYEADGDWWLKALHYCGEGHLQSVLDEYVAMLVEWRGYNRQGDRLGALAETVADFDKALTLRTSVYRVLRADGVEPDRESSMRGRFAVRFGDADSEDKQQQRVDAVSIAFNSPFWPFVLTSTSVGQEGLDFHLYCHAVSHWNLPSNPVDLEQREGRVHRYKGHAVRKNVAQGEGSVTGEGDPWQELFERAGERGRAAGHSEIVPYWVYLPEDSSSGPIHRIERHLPIAPYTREASRIEDLLSSVAYYRLAFGQPRQEELLRHVLANVTDENMRTELSEIRVDLSPPGVSTAG